VPGAAGQVELVPVLIDGIELTVPRGTLVIRAAEQVGIAIPRFCDHPLLEPAGACRQCLVEIATPDREGNLRWMPKPQASCTITVSPGMVVRTQETSEVADKAQHGVMELLLLNHPLDCPVCDKGGECPLQNQAMTNGRGETRFLDRKRTFPKPIRISTQVLLDRERCILCQRCTRFSQEIAGDPFIDLQERGAGQQIGTFSPELLRFATRDDRPGDRRPTGGDETLDPPGEAHALGVTEGPAELDESGQPFSSYYSGNTIQICPVGALTGAAYRFRARPFDLVSSPSVCEHCASGCAIRSDHRRGLVLRRLAGADPAVNEEWNCDKGRWAFQYAQAPDRLRVPLVRDPDTGQLVETSWPDALATAAAGLAAAHRTHGVGVLVGGRATVEDAYAYAKFARTVLDTNDIDFRARPHSAEEEAFLGHVVAGSGLGVTYADLEAAPAVLLVALDPQEESPILALRLRKAARRGLRVHDAAPFLTDGSRKAGASLLPTVPGEESALLRAMAGEATAPLTVTPEQVDAVRDALGAAGAVILVGERLAGVPGGFRAALDASAATGARLAWVPRRAGERGAVEAGALPGLLPGGRPIGDAAARVDVAAAWGVGTLPSAPGRDTAGILAAAEAGLGLVVGGVDPDDLPDPAQARRALAAATVVVSLEVRASAVHDHADVVLPVAPTAEKAGAFLDWEGRLRPFAPALATDALADHAILDELARELGVELGAADTAALRAELASIGGWDGARPPAPAVGSSAVRTARGSADGVVLATWPLLLDAGRMQDGEPYLAGTAHRAVARVSAATAARHGLAADGHVRVSGHLGDVVVPLAVTEMPDGVVWLPTNSRGCAVRAGLGAAAGDLVRLSSAPTGTPARLEGALT
jgi:NADH-quinone oxidoreductase subunit G